MIFYSISSILEQKFGILDLNTFFVNLIFASILLLIGLFLGWFVKLGLKKIIKKAELEKTTRKSFINLFLTVIKWSIYLLFISLALDTLGIPQLTSWITSAIRVIPAFVGALILIAVGFGIAVYLRDIIEESKILGWDILSMVFFYFILYVFMVFALKTALSGFEKNVVNTLIIILTAVVSAALAFWHVKIKK